MAWYQTRTDSELVELARGGDRRARATLFDRTIRPASAVALHLTAGDREAAIAALVTAYRLAFRRLHRLEDPERFTHWLLRLVDDRAPFPVGLPADSEVLTSFERDRVRRAVGVQTEVARKMARPAAVLVGLAIVGILVVVGSATLPSVQISDGRSGDAAAGGTGGAVLEEPTDEPSADREPAAVSSHEPTTDATSSEAQTVTESDTSTESETATEAGTATEADDDGGLAETR